MNRKIALLCSLTLLIATPSAAEGWLDSIKSMFGMSTTEVASKKTEALNITSMLGSITDTLGVSNDQAEGGVAAIINYVKGNLSTSEFSQLGESIPGLDGIMDAVPDISNLSSGGAGALFDNVANYSESLTAINNVKKQFEALGLSPEMISQFVTQIQGYLDTPEGAKAKDLIVQGVGKLMG